MAEPLISAVVPVYRVEALLPGCVESLLSQRIGVPFEILLVDDGSPDGCGALCDSYARRDSRVRALHQSNGGLSAARNTGTRAAKGRWITYVDGDDYVSPRFLSALLGAAEGCGAQAAVCRMREVEGAAALPETRPAGPAEVLTTSDALRRLLYQKGFDISAPAKLFMRTLALRWPFPEGYFFEDTLAVPQLFSQTERTAFLADELYAYVQRSGSAMHTRSARLASDEAAMTRAMLEFVASHCPEALQSARCKAFSNYCQILRSPAGTEDPLFSEAKAFLRREAPAVLADGNARFKNRGAALLACLSPGLLARI